MPSWLSSLITSLLKAIDPQTLKDGMDALLDVVEDKVQSSENKIDDTIVLPICSLIRQAFDIPDNDVE